MENYEHDTFNKTATEQIRGFPAQSKKSPDLTQHVFDSFDKNKDY